MGAGLNYVSDEDLSIASGQALAAICLPTARVAIVEAAVVPESFAAGDLRRCPAPMLIAGPAGWRDFYPQLCADNLTRQGHRACTATFALPEAETSKFDATPVGLRAFSTGRSARTRRCACSSRGWTARSASASPPC